MRHLRKFNEGLEDWDKSLKEFCEMNLAYLLDDSKFILTTKHTEISLSSKENMRRLKRFNEYFI